MRSDDCSLLLSSAQVTIIRTEHIMPVTVVGCVVLFVRDTLICLLSIAHVIFTYSTKQIALHHVQALAHSARAATLQRYYPVSYPPPPNSEDTFQSSSYCCTQLTICRNIRYSNFFTVYNYIWRFCICFLFHFYPRFCTCFMKIYLTSRI